MRCDGGGMGVGVLGGGDGQSVRGGIYSGRRENRRPLVRLANEDFGDISCGAHEAPKLNYPYPERLWYSERAWWLCRRVEASGEPGNMFHGSER